VTREILLHQDRSSFCGLARASGVAAEVLRQCGVDMAALIAATEQFTDYAATFASQLSEPPATIERIKRNAHAEARALRHNYTGTEHLLLSILSGDPCRAREILGKFNVDYALACATMWKVLGA